MHDANDQDIPISDRTLGALRTTAAMVVAVPHLAAVVRVGHEVVVEVRRPPHPASVPHKVLPPCAFHGAVAGAHRRRRIGQRVGMHGVQADMEPAIDWGVAGGARVLPGRMVRVELDGAWRHLVPVAVCEETAIGVLGGDPGRFYEVGCHGDDDLDVVILHTSSPTGDQLASRQAAEVLLSAVGAIGVADLEQRLGTVGADLMSPAEFDT